ncbi:DNA-3-methyladenine glycosylase family protein [Paenibacillus thermoaerophilus]|uniref:DNA-3-methyladenine glycosylase II n=1 Tax=Paenibacillus thermoaerophilus TaxID=1215385 RepID=A0ABW2V7M3_9BACL|nr:DNA-3-methyladenine glycosylase [Paenibacillus thermoaerophilus]TMV07337.1 DNA-3-methyladenine glycosylase 2 family protein [Paenibacillus thermoaerophilus]
MNDSAFELPLPSLFSFRECLAYMARSPLECLYEADGESVTRLVRAGSGTALVRLTCPGERAMRVQVLGGSVSQQERELLIRYIRDWFDLDRDLEPFMAIARTDSLAGPLVRERAGLRIVGIPDLFEALCWAIVGQQVNLAFAYKLKRRLTEAYGESAEREGTVYRLFPQPERLAGASVEELYGLQLTRNKAIAVLTVAERMAGGQLSRERLLALPDSQAVDRELTAIRGVGPWTSQYVRMRCLGDPTSLPIGDAGLQNAAKILLGLDRKPTEPELRDLFAPWRGWESYLTFYLWRTLY